VGREERERGWRNEGCVFVCVCVCVCASVKGQREIKQAHHLGGGFQLRLVKTGDDWTAVHEKCKVGARLLVGKRMVGTHRRRRIA
jgi:hypothetical protein